ncbi:Sec1-like protein [Zopfochytrium polystomum]|nr:Sec1-like protein [Zopfochytrium polystomum]
MPSASLVDIMRSAIFDQLAKIPRDAASVLVADLAAKDVLRAARCTRAELLSFGIRDVQSLLSKRPPALPAHAAAYLLSPTRPSVAQLLADFGCARGGSAARLYETAYVFFTAALPDELFDEMRHSGLLSYVKEMVELEIQFTPLDSRAFHLGLDHALMDALGPFKAETGEAVTSQIARRLRATLATLNEDPYIRYHDPSGDGTSISAAVARKLHESLKELKSVDPTFPLPTPYDGNGPATVLIVDRAVDLVAPLLHTLAYECILRENYPLEEVEVQELTRLILRIRADTGGKEAVVDESDELYASIRHLFFTDAFEAVNRALKDYQKMLEAPSSQLTLRSKMSTLSRRTLGKSGRAETQQEARSLTMEELRDAVMNLPDNLRKKQQLDALVNLNVDLNETIVNERKLAEVCLLEQIMAVGETTDGSPADVSARLEKILADVNIQSEDKLRLLLLYVITSKNLSESAVADLVDRAGIDVADLTVFQGLNVFGAGPLNDGAVVSHDYKPPPTPFTRQGRRRGLEAALAAARDLDAESSSSAIFSFSQLMSFASLAGGHGDAVANSLQEDDFLPPSQTRDFDRFLPAIGYILLDHIRGRLNATVLGTGGRGTGGGDAPRPLFPYIEPPAQRNRAEGRPSPVRLPGRTDRGSGVVLDLAPTVAALGGGDFKWGRATPKAIGTEDYRLNGPRTILFVVGGLSHAEIRAVHLLAKKLRREIYVGSTNVVEPSGLLALLEYFGRTTVAITTPKKLPDPVPAVGARDPIADSKETLAGAPAADARPAADRKPKPSFLAPVVHAVGPEQRLSHGVRSPEVSVAAPTVPAVAAPVATPNAAFSAEKQAKPVFPPPEDAARPPAPAPPPLPPPSLAPALVSAPAEEIYAPIPWPDEVDRVATPDKSQSAVFHQFLRQPERRFVYSPPPPPVLEQQQQQQQHQRQQRPVDVQFSSFDGVATPEGVSPDSAQYPNPGQEAGGGSGGGGKMVAKFGNAFQETSKMFGAALSDKVSNLKKIMHAKRASGGFPVDAMRTAGPPRAGPEDALASPLPADSRYPPPIGKDLPLPPLPMPWNPTASPSEYPRHPINAAVPAGPWLPPNATPHDPIGLSTLSSGGPSLSPASAPPQENGDLPMELHPPLPSPSQLPSPNRTSPSAAEHWPPPLPSPTPPSEFLPVSVPFEPWYPPQPPAAPMDLRSYSSPSGSYPPDDRPPPPPPIAVGEAAFWRHSSPSNGAPPEQWMPASAPVAGASHHHEQRPPPVPVEYWPPPAPTPSPPPLRASPLHSRAASSGAASASSPAPPEHLSVQTVPGGSGGSNGNRMEYRSSSNGLDRRPPGPQGSPNPLEVRQSELGIPVQNWPPSAAGGGVGVALDQRTASGGGGGSSSVTPAPSDSAGAKRVSPPRTVSMGQPLAALQQQQHQLSPTGAVTGAGGADRGSWSAAAAVSLVPSRSPSPAVPAVTAAAAAALPPAAVPAAFAVSPYSGDSAPGAPAPVAPPRKQRHSVVPAAFLQLNVQSALAAAALVAEPAVVSPTSPADGGGDAQPPHHRHHHPHHHHHQRHGHHSDQNQTDGDPNGHHHNRNHHHHHHHHHRYHPHATSPPPPIPAASAAASEGPLPPVPPARSAASASAFATAGVVLPVRISSSSAAANPAVWGGAE